MTWEVEVDAAYSWSTGIGHNWEGWEEALGYIFALFLSGTLHLYESPCGPIRCHASSGCGDLRTGVVSPASCVISIVVLSHRACVGRTMDKQGWQRVRTDFDFFSGFFFKPRHSDRWCIDGTFYLWPMCPNSLLQCVKCCFPQKVSCELAYFKNCNLWGERVFFDNITSLKPLGVESSLFLGSSMLFLVVLRIALVFGLYRKSPQ